MERVILGCNEHIRVQVYRLVEIANRYGFKIGDTETMKMWDLERPITGLTCHHIEIIGFLADVQQSRSFLAEVDALSGVYVECPEHTKRRLREQAEAHPMLQAR